MKNLRFVAVATLVMVGVLGAAVFLATAASASAAPGAKYMCTKCKIGAESAGKCPLCQKEMTRLGTYVCPDCDTTSDKPGKCMCGKDYVKTEMAGKKCPACGYYIAKDATSCPVCAAHAKKT